MSPDEVPRTAPAEARRRVQAGEALLVCAYASADKCERNKLEGSISLQEFEKRVPSLPLDREVIFYCA